MPRHPSFQLASLLSAGAVLAATGAHAAELGDAKVNSYLGQQLSADIELTSLHDAAGTVQVRVASLDVYRGAGLELPAVLSSVNLNVVRRDGKQFLHLTSTRPIEADHLHLYLALTDGGQRGVRLATLWFAPDPAPPAPPLVAAPVPAPPAVQELAPARPPRASLRPAPPRHRQPVRPLPEPVLAQDDPKPVPVREHAQPAPKPVHPAVAAAPVQSKPAGSKPAAVVAASKDIKPATPAKPAAAPAEPKPAPLALASQPHPAALALPKPAPACPKAPSQAESACSALDGKNAELRAELVKLEARVKTLQSEADARAAVAAKAASAPKPVDAPTPAMPVTPPAPLKAAKNAAAGEKFGQVIEAPPAPVFKPVKLKAVMPVSPAPPPKPETQPEGMPWGWIAGAGGGVFGTIGGLQFWRHRRKRGKDHRVHAPLPETDDEHAEPTFG